MTGELVYTHASGDSLTFDGKPTLSWTSSRRVTPAEGHKGISVDANKCLRTVRLSTYTDITTLPTINNYMKPDVVLDYDAGSDVQAAIQDDGGVYTDDTTDANDADAGDVALFADPTVVNDAFLIGMSCPVTMIMFTIWQANSGDLEVTWEYWNGSAWDSLQDVTDGTSHFTASGYVSWTLPPDWATSTINSQGPYYYMRARCTTGDAAYMEPLATRIYLYGVYPYVTVTFASGTVMTFPCQLQEASVTKSGDSKCTVSLTIQERTL